MFHECFKLINKENEVCDQNKVYFKYHVPRLEGCNIKTYIYFHISRW